MGDPTGVDPDRIEQSNVPPGSICYGGGANAHGVTSLGGLISIDADRVEQWNLRPGSIPLGGSIHMG